MYNTLKLINLFVLIFLMVHSKQNERSFVLIERNNSENLDMKELLELP